MIHRTEITTPEPVGDDRAAEPSLRPQRLEEFIGQEKVREALSIAVEAALQRREPLDHILFHGPPGLGKTTLAALLARELAVNLKTTSGPVLEKPADLVAVLTNQRERDVLFIDEIHRLRPVIEEFLYPAMEDSRIEIRVSEGPRAQMMTMNIERFTLVGATTRFGLLTAPMRARFGIVQRLGFYPPEDLATIVQRSSQILGIEVSVEGAAEIAKRSRGTPRVANRLLRRVRDFAQVRADGRIDRRVARDALALLDVDEYGLDQMGRPCALDAHREVRRRTRGTEHAGCRHGRGRTHAGGGLRALPHSGGLSPTHASGTRCDASCISTSRLQRSPRRFAADAGLLLR